MESAPTSPIISDGIFVCVLAGIILPPVHAVAVTQARRINMKQIIWAAALLMFPAVPASAQEANTQPHAQQPKGTVATPANQSTSTNDLDRFVQSYRKGDACKDLKSTGVAVDKLYDKEGFPIFDLVDVAGRHYGPASADDPDSTWDELIDCANQTHSGSGRAESLQVAAMWELWRAESFQKAYRVAFPLSGQEKPVDVVENIVRDYCGDDPYLAAEAKYPDRLFPPRDAQKEPYLVCREMVVVKALDAHVVALNKENRRLRTVLQSICALPDKQRVVRQACAALSPPKP